MVKRRNDVHLDRRLDHHIDEFAIVFADILDHHVVHLHESAVRLELFGFVFRNHQVARVGVRVHAVLMGLVHNELDVIYRDSAREDGFFGGVVVNEPAVETHQEEPRLVKAILLGQLLCAGKRTPGAEHQLVAASKHPLDGLHVHIENGLVVGQERSVQIGKKQLHAGKFSNSFLYSKT